LAGHKKPAFSVLFKTERHVALAVFVVDPLIDKKVFADNNNSTRTVVAWNLNQHVCGVVDWKNVLANHVVQPEIHLIES
jgi:hypothetical protein